MKKLLTLLVWLALIGVAIGAEVFNPFNTNRASAYPGAGQVPVWAGTDWIFGTGGAATNLTPWPSDINGANNSLTNVSTMSATNIIGDNTIARTNDPRLVLALTNAAAFDAAGTAAAATNNSTLVRTNNPQFYLALTNASAFDPAGSASAATNDPAIVRTNNPQFYLASTNAIANTNGLGTNTSLYGTTYLENGSGALSNSLLFGSTFSGTNNLTGTLNGTNATALFYDVVIGHSLTAPGPLTIYDDATGTNLLFATSSNAPTANALALVTTNWVNNSIWEAVWSPVVSPANIPFEGITGQGGFIVTNNNALGVTFRGGANFIGATVTATVDTTSQALVIEPAGSGNLPDYVFGTNGNLTIPGKIVNNFGRTLMDTVDVTNAIRTVLSAGVDAAGATNIPGSGIVSPFTSAMLTTSSSTNAPAQTELVTAQWVRSLLSGGFVYYSGTNINTHMTNTDTAGQPVYMFETNIPYPPTSRSYTNPSAGTYIGAVATTNTLTVVDSPITASAYMTLSSGGGDAMTIHAEIYYSYDGTNWLGDFSGPAQVLTPGATRLYQWTISFPAIVSTNSTGFYIERRYKVDSKSGSPIVTFLVGTNAVSGPSTASHISLAGPTSASGNAYLAYNQTFTGTNTFTKPIVGDAGAMTNVIATNIVFPSINWAGPSNVINLLNDYKLYVAAGNCAITNVYNASSGPAWVLLTVSNSTASAITVSMTAPAVRAIGSATTNSLSVAAGKVGVISLQGYGNTITNYATASQQ